MHRLADRGQGSILDALDSSVEAQRKHEAAIKAKGVREAKAAAQTTASTRHQRTTTPTPHTPNRPRRPLPLPSIFGVTTPAGGCGFVAQHAQVVLGALAEDELGAGILRGTGSIELNFISEATAHRNGSMNVLLAGGQDHVLAALASSCFPGRLRAAAPLLPCLHTPNTPSLQPQPPHQRSRANNNHTPHAHTRGMPPSLTSASIRHTDSAGDLEVHFDPCDPGLKYALVADTASSRAPAAAYTLKDDKRFKDGVPDNDIWVYRGTLLRTSETIQVVVKVALTPEALEELVNEGRFYCQRLDVAPGVPVPVCYGAHRVLDTELVQEKMYAWGCLVLEDCGEALGSFDGEVDEGFRSSLVNAVLALHAAQIIHGQLDPRHVLLRDGRPYIVDFSRASAVHACAGSKSLSGLGDDCRLEFGREIDPGKDGFGCDELYEVLKAMRVLRPATLRMCGTDHWDARLIQDPQALADEALAWQDGLTATEAFEVAHEAILRYYREWMPGSDEVARQEDASYVRGARYRDDMKAYAGSVGGRGVFLEYEEEKATAIGSVVESRGDLDGRLYHPTTPLISEKHPPTAFAFAPLRITFDGIVQARRGRLPTETHTRAVEQTFVGALSTGRCLLSVIGVLKAGRPENSVYVYRAILTLADDVDDAGVAVVVKVAASEDAQRRLVEEGRLYAGCLAELQGVHVPSCYGAYDVRLPESARGLRDAYGFLMLQDCGSHVASFEGADVDEDFRDATFSALKKIHAAGVMHGDIQPKHVVRGVEGRSFIVDFSKASSGHACTSLDMAWNQFLLFDQPQCPKIYRAARELRVLAPDEFEWYGTLFPITYLNQAEELARRAPSSYDEVPALALWDAYVAILAYYKEWFWDAAVELSGRLQHCLVRDCEAFARRRTEEADATREMQG
ncbi:unnamed protein product [Peniophora sp. CBMAI 1063]|nr:unnamed protein product [Peniophora sp. CBMAI 1063]